MHYNSELAFGFTNLNDVEFPEKNVEILLNFAMFLVGERPKRLLQFVGYSSRHTSSHFVLSEAETLALHVKSFAFYNIVSGGDAKGQPFQVCRVS